MYMQSFFLNVFPFAPLPGCKLLSAKSFSTCRVYILEIMCSFDFFRPAVLFVPLHCYA